VRGSGDGGIYSTPEDLGSFWRALFEGRIVARERVDEMIRPRSTTEDGSKRYGLGFWLHASSDAVWLEGHDAGVSFDSQHDPATDTTYTVISNSSEGAWPVSRLLSDGLDGSA
jgi:CubicO group peptidase (beta-lactamase class C family)